MSKLILLALPAAVALVVGLALFVLGAPGPYLGARLYGGPTQGSSRLSLRVVLFERLETHEFPSVPCGLVELSSAGGRVFRWQGALDDEGTASFDVPLESQESQPWRVAIRECSERGRLIAQGSIALTGEAWMHNASRRGGWLEPHGSGTLVVRVAPGLGAFAVPFADPLIVEVRRSLELDEQRAAEHAPTQPVARAKLELEVEGARLAPCGGARAPNTCQALTDSNGRARFELQPSEHVVLLRVDAEADFQRGKWYGVIPVVPGATHAVLEQSRLQVHAPTERDKIYFSVVSPEERVTGGVLRLTPDGRGGSVGGVELADLPAGPLWAVVSSQFDLSSAATLGWPLRPQLSAAPPQTFDVADQLLLEGLHQDFQRERSRRQKARWLALAFTLCAAGLAVALLLRQAQHSSAALDAHLKRAGLRAARAERIAPPSTLSIVIAVMAVGACFVLLGLLALFRDL